VAVAQTGERAHTDRHTYIRARCYTQTEVDWKMYTDKRIDDDIGEIGFFEERKLEELIRHKGDNSGPDGIVDRRYCRAELGTLSLRYWSIFEL
jgi:hypothetical protein